MSTEIAIQTQQFLTFQLAADTLAMMPTGQLAEILSINLAQIVEIPDMSAAVMGATNWRGEVLWLVDLGYYLGFESFSMPTNSQATCNVIIIRSRDRIIGFVVEKVRKMVRCDVSQIQPARSGQTSPQLERCLKGYWLAAKQEMFLALDGDALVRAFDL